MKYALNGLIALVLLRIAIGWHLFYEGMVKVLNPHWTSKTYLLDSGGFAKSFFHWIAQNPTALSIADFMNAWGLSLIGFSLLVGLFSRYAALAGMFLLALYYLSHPPFPGIEYLLPSDGSYFIINKTLIELFALYVVFACPTSHIIGVERFFNKQGTKSYG
jgi:thiosulfate dehydrogenase [quinone] large subunit